MGHIDLFDSVYLGHVEGIRRVSEERLPLCFFFSPKNIRKIINIYSFSSR